MLKTNWNHTFKLWIFGFVKVPMIFWLRPKIVTLTKESAIVKISLTRRSKNHLKSMYFGALCVGADIAGGVQMMNVLGKDLKKISFAFKDIKGEFLKRPEAEVYFTCHDGKLIADTIQKAFQSHERENVAVQIVATTPSLLKDEPVARFTLTLSIKEKKT